MTKKTYVLHNEGVEGRTHNPFAGPIASFDTFEELMQYVYAHTDQWARDDYLTCYHVPHKPQVKPLPHKPWDKPDVAFTTDTQGELLLFSRDLKRK